MMDSPILFSPQSRWLTLARVFQILIICLAVGMFIMSIPLNYEQRSDICETEPCPPNQLKSESVQALHERETFLLRLMFAERSNAGRARLEPCDRLWMRTSQKLADHAVVFVTHVRTSPCEIT